jgi:succinoglycan biosynthesis protein ExoM
MDYRDRKMPSEAIDLISVVIPTLNRPGPLRRALTSAVAQQLPAGIGVEIIVVDNSVDANARQAVEQQIDSLRQTHPSLTLRYLSEPNPGVANARNAGVKAAKGDWIAFLDDDEEACPKWIASHLSAARLGDADAVFGPVSARAEEQAELGVFGSLFSRQFDLAPGGDLTPRAAYLGTNNSMFNRMRCLNLALPFAVALNTTGGEDSLLLMQLALSGHRFVWSADAHVTEWVPSRRLSWEYYRKRKFLSGQIRTFVFSMLESPQWLQVAKWMAIGAAQFAICSLAAGATILFAPNRARALWASALGGLGKVFWMKRFRAGLYGCGLVS